MKGKNDLIEGRKGYGKPSFHKKYCRCGFHDYKKNCIYLGKLVFQCFLYILELAIQKGPNKMCMILDHKHFSSSSFPM